MIEFFRWLFDTDGFPARWNCGSGWTSELGWTHILSDIVIWGSYTAIPIVLAVFIIRRRDVPFPRIFWLFIAFIFFCGTGHLIEAIIFWEPVYRLAGAVKVGTAIVSLATVCALVPTMPRALSLRSPEQLELEVAERTRSLQESESHQRVLMGELDHRVKNNIAAIMSLADQTMSAKTTFADFREAFMGRMMALTRTHEALAKSRWVGAEVRWIVGLTLDPYQTGLDHPLRISGPGAQLDARAASSLCMSIHELATNSIKYGSLSKADGTVDVNWTVDDDGLHIRWVERGGPAVGPPVKPGFGTKLLRGMIEHDLEGKVVIDYQCDGLECAIMIPAVRVTVLHDGHEGRA